MPSGAVQSTPQRPALSPAHRWAQSTCMLFGVALLVSGLTPAVVQRLVSGETPPATALASSSVTLLVGGLYLVLGTVIARGIAWALWSVLSLSLVLAAGAAFMPLLTGDRLSLFALLLPVATASTSLLALASRPRGVQAPPADIA